MARYIYMHKLKFLKLFSVYSMEKEKKCKLDISFLYVGV